MITCKQQIKYLILAGVVLSLLGLFALNSSAAGLQLNGNWSTPFGDDDGPWNLGQSYNLSLGHDFTSAIKMNANLRYSTNERQGFEKTENMSPSITLGLTNDIFRISVNGSQNQRWSADTPKSTTTAWNSTIASNLTDQRWPKLRLTYGESNSTTDESPKTQDADTKSLSTSMDYSWEFIQLLHNYRNTQNTDNISQRETESQNHSSNIQIAKSIWNNKISFSGSYQHSESDSTTSSLTKSTGGTITLDVPSSGSFAGLDSTPETGTLPNAPSLNDGNTVTATTIELPGIAEQLNIALQVNFNPTNRLQVHFDRQLTATTQQRLHWALYTSINGNDWTLLPEIPLIEFIDEDDQTYALLSLTTEIRTARYIKAVITKDLGGDSAFITEMLAQQDVLLGDDKTKFSTSNTSRQIQASINYRPWEKLQVGYSFSQNENEPSNGATSTQKTHSVNSHLNLNRYFSLSLNMGESTDTIEGLSENRSQSYSFAYLTSPIDSVNFSVNGTRSNQFEDDLKTQTSDSISSNLTTTIVPDLTTSIAYVWTKNTDHSSDLITTNNSYTFNLMARINSRLNASYYFSRQDSTSHRMSLSYRPSDLISTTLSAIKTDDATSYSTTVHWRITPKIQNDLNYSLSQVGSDTSHNATYNFSWNISQYFSIRQNMRWSKSDEESTWSGLLSLSYSI